jgi:Ca2+-binding EF-hand superfamily protein
MKRLPRVGRLAPGVLALFFILSPLVTRAQEGSDKLSKAKAKYDTDQDGKLSGEEKAKARADAADHAQAGEAAKQKQLLAKYDANGNGQIDENEQSRLKADEAAQAEKYRQALAAYDANHNGVLDRDELAKMKEDERLAAKTERQAEKGDASLRRKIDRAEGKDVPKAHRKR